MNRAPRNLGITGIESVEFAVRDLTPSRMFYERRMDFACVGASSPAWTRQHAEKALVFEAGNILVQCTAPTGEPSGVHDFLRRHPEGVRRVALGVQDIDHAWRTLEDRGACMIDAMQQEGSVRWFDIASPLGDLQYRFMEGTHLAWDPASRFAPLPGIRATPADSTPSNRHGFTHVDHITSNIREIRSVVAWYREVLGFEHHWDIRFHTRDSHPDHEGGSGLNSVVMQDPDSGTKLATNEPLRPGYHRSQIAKFVADNHGPGVQHVALGTRDILAAVHDMRGDGLGFLDTPDAYYRALPARLAERAVDNLREDLEDLRRNRILVDGRDRRYLLQIFMQERAVMAADPDAGPFFYELIQRRGAQGFGEGNFRALFESIERQQEETLETSAAVGTA